MPTFPKPEQIAKGKRRKARTEAAVEKVVREACVLRDGRCLLWTRQLWLPAAGGCDGPSQWTHLPPHTRAQTRGLPVDERHSTEWTIMACQRHHDMIDGRRKPKLILTPTTPDGADGPIEVRVK